MKIKNNCLSVALSYMLRTLLVKYYTFMYKAYDTRERVILEPYYGEAYGKVIPETVKRELNEVQDKRTNYAKKCHSVIIVGEFE